MKVLSREKENKSKFPITIECEHCGAVLQIDNIDEIKKGYLGQGCVECPVCNKDTYNGLEDFSEEITVDTVKFPDHFYYFGNGVELKNTEIKNYIKDIIGHFRKEPEAFASSTSSGDTMVFGFNFSGDNEYQIIVAKDYYETSIPYEPEDYELQNSIDWGWKNIPTSNIANKARMDK